MIPRESNEPIACIDRDSPCLGESPANPHRRPRSVCGRCLRSQSIKYVRGRFCRIASTVRRSTNSFLAVGAGDAVGNFYYLCRTVCMR